MRQKDMLGNDWIWQSTTSELVITGGQRNIFERDKTWTYIL